MVGFECQHFQVCYETSYSDEIRKFEIPITNIFKHLEVYACVCKGNKLANRLRTEIKYIINYYWMSFPLRRSL